MGGDSPAEEDLSIPTPSLWERWYASHGCHPIKTSDQAPGLPCQGTYLGGHRHLFIDVFIAHEFRGDNLTNMILNSQLRDHEIEIPTGSSSARHTPRWAATVEGAATDLALHTFSSHVHYPLRAGFRGSSCASSTFSLTDAHSETLQIWVMTRPALRPSLGALANPPGCFLLCARTLPYPSPPSSLSMMTCRL